MRKKKRQQKLKQNNDNEILLDPQNRRDHETIINEKLKREKTIQLIKNDRKAQVN